MRLTPRSAGWHTFPAAGRLSAQRLQLECATRKKPRHWNAVGDFLAGWFAPMAFAWFLVAVFLQMRELKLQRLEFEKMREEQEKGRISSERQSESAARQVFVSYYGKFNDALMEHVSYVYVYSRGIELIASGRLETAEVLVSHFGIKCVIQKKSEMKKQLLNEDKDGLHTAYNVISGLEDNMEKLEDDEKNLIYCYIRPKMDSIIKLYDEMMDLSERANLADLFRELLIASDSLLFIELAYDLGSDNNMTSSQFLRHIGVDVSPRSGA